MKRNTASQLVSAQMIAIADGSNVIAGTCNVAVEIDGVPGTGGTATHIANGKWEFAPIQADTDGNYLTFQFSITGAITQTVQVFTSNNLSTSEVAAELATYDAPTFTEMVAAFTEIKGATWAVTDTLEDIRDTGVSPTVEQIRVEIDSNSTQLASLIVAIITNAAGADVSADVAAAKAIIDATQALAAGTSGFVATKADTAANKVVTDQMKFTKTDELDVNTKSINTATVIGDGNATPWNGG